jgi:murein DD-endopeptidase MepM/ murein hydrolase activator NlpD
MPSHRRAMNPARPLLPPLAVLGVAAAVAVTIVSGRPGTAAAAPSAAGVDVPLAASSAAASKTATAHQVASQRDISRALQALEHTGDQRSAADRASRSHRRTALQHRWVRPDIGPLSSPFGYRWGTLHPGDDLAGPYGSPIVAATDGCIEAASWDGGYGNRILIHDWDGTDTLYGHMSAFVRTSGCVKAGEVIGREGSTGYSTGPHLHFEVHVNGVAIDPLPFMAERGVRF